MRFFSSLHVFAFLFSIIFTFTVTVPSESSTSKDSSSDGSFHHSPLSFSSLRHVSSDVNGNPPIIPLDGMEKFLQKTKEITEKAAAFRQRYVSLWEGPIESVGEYLNSTKPSLLPFYLNDLFEGDIWKFKGTVVGKVSLKNISEKMGMPNVNPKNSSIMKFFDWSSKVPLSSVWHPSISNMLSKKDSLKDIWETPWGGDVIASLLNGHLKLLIKEVNEHSGLLLSLQTNVKSKYDQMNITEFNFRKDIDELKAQKKPYAFKVEERRNNLNELLQLNVLMRGQITQNRLLSLDKQLDIAHNNMLDASEDLSFPIESLYSDIKSDIATFNKWVDGTTDKYENHQYEFSQLVNGMSDDIENFHSPSLSSLNLIKLEKNLMEEFTSWVNLHFNSLAMRWEEYSFNKWMERRKADLKITTLRKAKGLCEKSLRGISNATNLISTTMSDIHDVLNIYVSNLQGLLKQYEMEYVFYFEHLESLISVRISQLRRSFMESENSFNEYEKRKELALVNGDDDKITRYDKLSQQESVEMSAFREEEEKWVGYLSLLHSTQGVDEIFKKHNKKKGNRMAITQQDNHEKAVAIALELAKMGTPSMQLLSSYTGQSWWSKLFGMFVTEKSSKGSELPLPMDDFHGEPQGMRSLAEVEEAATAGAKKTQKTQQKQDL